MRFFGYYLRFPRWGEHAWWRWFVTILGLTALCVAIWIGGPMTGWGPLTTIWLRATLIGLILGIFFLVVFIRWRRRVRAARDRGRADPAGARGRRQGPVRKDAGSAWRFEEIGGFQLSL